MTGGVASGQFGIETNEVIKLAAVVPIFPVGTDKLVALYYDFLPY